MTNSHTLHHQGLGGLPGGSNGILQGQLWRKDFSMSLLVRGLCPMWVKAPEADSREWDLGEGGKRGLRAGRDPD